MALLVVGCSNRFEVDQAQRRPDAAVETFPPSPICRHEPHEVGAVASGADGQPAAALVRWREQALLVRVDPTAADAPARVVIASIATGGTISQEGVTTDTGEAGAVSGLSVVAAGGGLHAAITRDDGRVDLLALSIDGASEHPPRSLRLGAKRPARLLWHRGAPLLEVDGAVHRPGGAAGDASGDAGVDGSVEGSGDEGGSDGGDAGAAPLPGALQRVVVAGEALGWLHGDDTGLWLSHRGAGSDQVRTVRVGRDGEATMHLLWAGDRYLVGDGAISSISRYVIPEGRRRRAGSPLSLGGRFVVPGPPSVVAHTAWDNAGPRHVGVAQTLGSRHIRFLNLALAGQVLDAETHLRTERDVAGLLVQWDGRGYVLAWSEADGERRGRLSVTRFSCPDDE